MADNVAVTPGSGATVATRDTGGGVEVQRVIPNTWSGGVATDVSSTNPLPATTTLKDGSTTNLATVAVFHNVDNQPPGGLGFGLLTGGVAQLININGNLDRQRETGVDNIPPIGIASGTQQLASPFSTTIAVNVSSGTQTVTPALMSGTNRGATWSIQVGSVLTVANSNGSNSENVVVTSVTGTTFTATFASNKTGPGITVKGYTYNQARDATTPDGSTGQGFAAGATFLFNATLNNNAGGWESERSAAGELDGANGAGTAVAAEYENNSGGPPLPSGLPSNLQYDRGRNIAGKGLLTATISSGATANSTTITVSSATAVNLLQPGAPLYLLTGGLVTEVVYVSATYVPGTAAISLQNAVVTGGETTCAFDAYVPNGPKLSGFLATGIEIAEEALYDPVSDRYYLERSATADAMATQNIIAESNVLYNGSTFDRARGAVGVAEVSQGGRQTTAIAAGTSGNTTVKSGAGRLGRVLITTAGTAAVTIYDNTAASGTIIGYIAASAAAGTIVDFQMPAATGITVAGNAALPALTVSWT